MDKRFRKCICKKQKIPCKIKINYDREKNITQQIKQILKNVYNNKHECIQHMFVELASQFSVNCEHAQRMYDYISQQLFMPATPVIRYVNDYDRAPISCFTGYLCNIKELQFMEEIKLFYKHVIIGGGSALNISKVRPANARDARYSHNGVIRYIRAIELMHSCIEHHRDRAAISSYYLSVDHPEIEKFIAIRSHTTDTAMLDIATKCNIGVIISDEFMLRVINNQTWDLVHGDSKVVYKTVSARALWLQMIALRLETGEPYLYFEGNVERYKSLTFKKLNLPINTSNICTEIALPTGYDHLGNNRNGVCCLGSLNMEKYDQILQYKDTIFEDCLLYLDNVLQCFLDIEEADVQRKQNLSNSYYGAYRGRALGLGITGLHNLFMLRNIPFDSEQARELNRQICTLMKTKCDEAQEQLAEAYGPCPDNHEAGVNKRNATSIAIAPCSHISMLLDTSLGINPLQSNYYIRKTSGGNVIKINKYLLKYIQKYSEEQQKEILNKVMNSRGSVQHIDEIDDHAKKVFKTAYEIDQMAHITLCADRNAIFDGEQAQSINLFINYDVSVSYVNKIHIQAYRHGIKTLYYIYNTPAIFANNSSENELIQTNTECIECA